MTSKTELKRYGPWIDWEPDGSDAFARMGPEDNGEYVRHSDALAAIEAARPVWRPGSEAPKDGTSILGHWKEGTYDCAIYAVKFHRGKWWQCNEDYVVREPSHWMPLPPPPESE